MRMESRIDVIATVKNFDRYFNKGRLHDQIIPRLSVFPIMTLLIIQHIWHANSFFSFACFFFFQFFFQFQHIYGSDPIIVILRMHRSTYLF